MFPDLCETPLKDLAPLDVLRAFVRRFGLDITIGDKTDKLFLMETVPLIAPVKRIKLLTIANPEVHSYVTTSLAKIDPPTRTAAVALAISIDTDEYAGWVREHG